MTGEWFLVASKAEMIGPDDRVKRGKGDGNVRHDSQAGLASKACDLHSLPGLPAQKGPRLGLMLCCHLEIITF